MDINDNQQINTFMKGMNTDVSDALIDSSQYRYAENLRLVTNTDSNSGELRLIEGTQPININFGTLLAFTSVRDMLIAIVKESGVSIYISNDKGYNWNGVVKNIPYKEFIQEGETEPHFSLVTRWESDENVKLYIADGIHQIICVNLKRNYIVQDVDNTIDDIAPYLSVPLQAPFISIISGGNLQSARVQYAYRLYNVGEPASTTSPLSNICSIYKTENEGYNVEEISNKAAVVTIPSNDGNFEKLQIYRINYVIHGQAPSVALIYDGDVISSYTDRGQEIEVSSDVEFLSATQLKTIPKVIESKEDYLFAGNIQYGQDQYDNEISDLNFRSYSWGDFVTDVPDFVNYTNTRDYNKQYDQNVVGDISKFHQQYWADASGDANVCGGTGPIVSWRFTTDDVLIDKDNTIYDYTGNTKGSIIDNDVLSLRRGDVYRYGIILYNTNGVKSSVKWIADIMVPESVYDAEKNRWAEYPKPVWQGSTLIGWWFTTIGIKFTINIPQQYDVYGYEIVRCKRSYEDMFTISQGIIGTPTEFKSDENYIMQSPGFITQEDMFQTDSEHTLPDSIKANYKYLIFCSPEYAYQPDDIQDIIKQNKNSIYIDDLVSYFHPLSSQSYDYSYGDITVNSARRFDTLSGYGSNEHSLIIKSNSGVGRCLIEHIRVGEEESSWSFEDSRHYGIYETALTHVVAANEVNIFKKNSIIKDFSFPEVADPNHFFSTNKAPLWINDVIPVGGKTFLAWTSPQWVYNRSISDPQRVYDIYSSDYRNDELYDFVEGPSGIAGKCVVFELQEERDALRSQGPQDLIVAPITVSNLKKSAYPYQGPTSYKTSGPEYYSHGNYKLNSGSNTIVVKDGDCFPGIFTYIAEHAFNNGPFPAATKSTIVYYVPLESDINLKATCGSIYTRLQNINKAYYARYLAGEMDGYVQEHDMYLYNTAYNSEPYITSYSNINYTRIDTGKFDTRVHHSDKKTNNEQVDSWGTFKAHNYIDVDTRFGEITNMRLFKDKLLFWQKDAVGILSVNERTMLNDVSDNQLILGTGSTLQRFDYISTKYGMKKNQYEAEVQSNTTQYWWDGVRREILAYAGGTELLPLTKTKSVTNYINERGDKSHPTLIYDNKYNEVIASVVGTKSLIYSEQVQAFVSTYLFTPIYRAVVDNTIVVTDDKSFYEWNAEGDGANLFGVDINPLVRYVVNKNSSQPKVFDISTFGGRFYGGDEQLDNLTFTFDTPLKQHSTGSGRSLITNREYDFRLDIPRNNNDIFGGRMRGKTMQCELKSSNNSYDFSLQYIITKYRMSWS